MAGNSLERSVPTFRSMQPLDMDPRGMGGQIYDAIAREQQQEASDAQSERSNTPPAVFHESIPPPPQPIPPSQQFHPVSLQGMPRPVVHQIPQPVPHPQQFHPASLQAMSRHVAHQIPRPVPQPQPAQPAMRYPRLHGGIWSPGFGIPVPIGEGRYAQPPRYQLPRPQPVSRSGGPSQPRAQSSMHPAPYPPVRHRPSQPLAGPRGTQPLVGIQAPPMRPPPPAGPRHNMPPGGYSNNEIDAVHSLLSINSSGESKKNQGESSGGGPARN